MNEHATRHLQLSDGRTLSYSATGTGENGTWIHCHGIPGSRLELAHLNEVIISSGLRVIVPDRPGYGGSTPLPEYGFEQHATDLAELVGHLGLQGFSISGFSGGGVFALGTACHMGDPAETLLIAGTPAVPLMQSPFDHASDLTGGSWQAALTNADDLAVELQALTQSADTLCDALLRAVGEDERHYLTAGPGSRAFRDSVQAAVQQGPVESARALARDTRLTAAAWPFDTAQLTLPVRILHGDMDQLVHSAHQRALANALPHAEQVSYADRGHFDLQACLFSSTLCGI